MDLQLTKRDTDIVVPKDDAILIDGCVLLGSKEVPSDNYITRFHIDHDEQRQDLCNEIFFEECIPFCKKENRKSVKSCLWNFISSEAFLFTLHVATIVLGAVKEALNMRTVAEVLHLVHSVIETFLALLQTLIRLISAWMSYRALRQDMYRLEHVDPEMYDCRGRNLRVWLNVVTAICVTMMVGVVVCFLVFYYEVHLGWTLLSNQFAMISVTTAANLFQARVSSLEARINGDHHKAVLYEAVRLIAEGNDSDKAKAFISSLVETPQFLLPHYIRTTDNSAKHWMYDVSCL